MICPPPKYFDSLLLLNMRVVAFGPIESVFQYELLQNTYGGRLTILSEVADAVAERPANAPDRFHPRPSGCGAAGLSRIPGPPHWGHRETSLGERVKRFFSFRDPAGAMPYWAPYCSALVAACSAASLSADGALR